MKVVTIKLRHPTVPMPDTFTPTAPKVVTIALPHGPAPPALDAQLATDEAALAAAQSTRSPASLDSAASPAPIGAAALDGGSPATFPPGHGDAILSPMSSTTKIAVGAVAALAGVAVLKSLL